uniref:Uncharacterized protein n=1 Tax=Branchiostoma floridae TaxID=7739 RepID=C3ZA98_BRAFL|eukprot:XP_002594480.1 hypothetical protein BRAFLDRAFT_124959 [Branchiostoma floridae]
MLHTSVTAVILLLLGCWTSVVLAADDASFDDPEVGHFSVSSIRGKKCLLLDIAARFHVQYEKNDNTTAEVSYAVPIDSVATAESSTRCSSRIETCPQEGPKSKDPFGGRGLRQSAVNIGYCTILGLPPRC